jgi:tetratricopeptide (TPR) repeat protein
VLVDTVKAHPEPRIVSGALAITMHAMSGEIDAEDPESARRTFKAAGPILKIADDRALSAKLSPSAARVRAMMGEIELREGRLEEARQLLVASAAAEKSGLVLLSLARIEWHDGKIAAALEHLRDALGAEDTIKDPALRGEILLTTSDITREQGDMTAARTPLTEALKELAKARSTPAGEERARVERVLSRVLDRFGAAQPATRALERALEAAPRDKRQAAATVGQLVGRAFVKGDLKAARDGLQRGLAADLDVDDLVYYALWVRLLERQLKTPTDGTPERIFQSTADSGRWIGKIAQFGAGTLKAEDLVAAASTPAQKTEALFYAAMDRRVSGDAKGGETGLRQVLVAGGVDLMEVAIARDLLSGSRAEVGGPLPSGVAIP